MEAWAVLADTEEVGGPVEKIGRLGVLKSVGGLVEGEGLLVA